MVKSQPIIQMPPRKLCCSTLTMLIPQVYTKPLHLASKLRLVRIGDTLVRLGRIWQLNLEKYYE
jgi:hypothetical protein